MPSAKAISFTPEVLKAKLRALEEYGQAQTRRPIRPAPPSGNGTERWTFCVSSTEKASINRFTLAQVDPSGHLYTERGRERVLANVRPPMGLSGQVLWVRERALVTKTIWQGRKGWKAVLRYDDGNKSEWLDYPSRLKDPVEGRCIANGVFREGARHFLEVVDVKVERLHAVTEEDARLEGFEDRMDFLATFYGIYGGECAGEGPWVFVYTLKRATRP